MTKVIYKVYDVLGVPIVNRLIFLIMFIIPLILSEFFSVDLNNKYILVPWMSFGFLSLAVGILGIKYVAVIKEFSSCEERIRYINKWEGKAITPFIAGNMLAKIDRNDMAKLFLNYASPVSEVLPKFKKLNEDEKYQVLSCELKYKLVNSIVYENECVKHVMDYTDASIYDPETKFFFDLNVHMNSYFKLKKYEVIELGFGEYLDNC